MIPFKQQWTVESAMRIAQHPTVDSDTWASAVEWLLLHGPPEIRALLDQAGAHAASVQFPELKPRRFATDGSPCYDLAELAHALGISEDEVRKQLMEKERQHGVQHGLTEDDTTGLQ
jgi:predicted PhzF superfamily epimerase YddE/YHI9